MKIPKLRLALLISLILIIIATLLAGCGGSNPTAPVPGTQQPGGTQPPPTSPGQWDSMQWDQGIWG